MQKFPLGQIVATPGTIEALEEAGQTPRFLSRSACARHVGRSLR